MGAPQPTKKKPFSLQNLESMNRISTLPLVESGWNYAESLYTKIKNSNTLLHWTLVQAESSFHMAVDTALPTIALFEVPISSLDKILCKSLDIVEQKVPSIGLPPEIIYWNTKQYVTDVSVRIVRPVLKRADSVKQIGNTVLSSKYTAFAADTLDGALNVADKYVDKYLPAAVYDDQNINESETNIKDDENTNKAIKTIHHVGRFSGKLQRRLTKRTLAEAKALKEQSAEAIHVLIYVAELVATDPKLALAKGKELWETLSKDEPENQARPENLEQLIVLLTRETARRIVHFINYTGNVVTKIPKNVTNSLMTTISKLLQFADSIAKNVHLEEVQEAIITFIKSLAHYFTLLPIKPANQVTDTLDDVTKSLTPFPENVTNTLATVSKSLTPSLGKVTESLDDVGKTLIPSLENVTDYLENVTDSLTPSLGHDDNSLDNVPKSSHVTEFLTPTLEHVTDNLDNLGKTSTSALGSVTDTPCSDNITHSLTSSLALTPALEPVTDNLANVSESLAPSVEHVTDILDNVAQSSTPSPELAKSVLEVPKIKVQLRAFNLVKNSNGVDANSN